MIVESSGILFFFEKKIISNALSFFKTIKTYDVLYVLIKQLLVVIFKYCRVEPELHVKLIKFVKLYTLTKT